MMLLVVINVRNQIIYICFINVTTMSRTAGYQQQFPSHPHPQVAQSNVRPIYTNRPGSPSKVQRPIGNQNSHLQIPTQEGIVYNRPGVPQQHLQTSYVPQQQQSQAHYIPQQYQQPQPQSYSYVQNHPQHHQQPPQQYHQQYHPQQGPQAPLYVQPTTIMPMNPTSAYTPASYYGYPPNPHHQYPLLVRHPQNLPNMNFDYEEANFLCDAKIKQNTIYCIICQEDYRQSQRQAHVLRHKREPQKGMSNSRLNEIQKYSDLFKKQYAVRPIIEPDEHYVKWNPNVYKLVEKIQYEDDDEVAKMDVAIGGGEFVEYPSEYHYSRKEEQNYNNSFNQPSQPGVSQYQKPSNYPSYHPAESVASRREQSSNFQPNTFSQQESLNRQTQQRDQFVVQISQQQSYNQREQSSRLNNNSNNNEIAFNNVIKQATGNDPSNNQFDSSESQADKLHRTTLRNEVEWMNN